MESMINLEGHIYPYQVTFKKMRSIIVKVVQGKLVVSCPYGTDRRSIESLMQRNAHKLVTSLQSYVPNLSVEEGYVILYGHKVPLIIRDLGLNKCVLHTQGLYVYSHDVEAAFAAYARQEIYDYTYQRTKEYLEKYFDHPMCEIVVKKYKGRWGSCYYTKNRISYNQEMIHIEKDLIDYVVMHELCHFLEANHSAAFYRELGKRMPDYRSREKRLKEKHI